VTTFIGEHTIHLETFSFEHSADSSCLLQTVLLSYGYGSLDEESAKINFSLLLVKLQRRAALAVGNMLRRWVPPNQWRS